MYGILFLEALCLLSFRKYYVQDQLIALEPWESFVNSKEYSAGPDRATSAVEKGLC